MVNTWENRGKTLGKWWFTGGLIGFYEIYPLVMTNIAMVNDDPFIVDFPSYKPAFIGDFPWLC